MSLFQTNIWVLIQRLLLAVCLIVILFSAWTFHQSQEDFFALITHGWKELGWLVVCTILIQLCVAYELLLVVRRLGLRGCRLLSWLQIVAVSNLVNLTVSQGGNLYRMSVLKERYNFSLTDSVASIFAFGWLISLFITLIGVCSLVIHQILFPLESLSPLLFLSLYFILLVVAIPLFRLSAKLFAAFGLPMPQKWNARVLQLISGIDNLLRDYRLATMLIGLSLIAFPLYYISIQLSFLVFNVSPTASSTIIYIVVTVAGRLINIVPGNFGIAEVSVGIASEALGDSLAAGTLAALLLRFATVAVTVALGGIALAAKPWLGNPKPL